MLQAKLQLILFWLFVRLLAWLPLAQLSSDPSELQTVALALARHRSCRVLLLQPTARKSENYSQVNQYLRHLMPILMAQRLVHLEFLRAPALPPVAQMRAGLLKKNAAH